MRLPRMDLHVHTASSDGNGDLNQVIEQAKRAGLQAVAITEHFDDEGRKCVSETELLRQANQLAAASHSLVVILGVEAGLFTRLSPTVRDSIDLVIRSVHSFPGMKHGTKLFDDDLWTGYKSWVLKALSVPDTDVLGHVEGYLPLPPEVTRGTTFEERREMERAVAERYFDQEWQEAVARTALANGVAVEVHAGSRTPRVEFLRICRKYGVKFSIGSDAHSLDDVGRVDWAMAALEELGVDEGGLLPCVTKLLREGNTRLTGAV